MEEIVLSYPKTKYFNIKEIIFRVAANKAKWMLPWDRFETKTKFKIQIFQILFS